MKSGKSTTLHHDIRALTHRIKQLHILTLIWWVIRIIFLLVTEWFFFISVRDKQTERFYDTWGSGFCIQNAYIGDTSEWQKGLTIFKRMQNCIDLHREIFIRNIESNLHITSIHYHQVMFYKLSNIIFIECPYNSCFFTYLSCDLKINISFIGIINSLSS